MNSGDVLTAIDDVEEFTRDWDWYACDPDGNIGHFTTAGFRKLPKGIKEDRDAADYLRNFFFDDLSPSCGYTVREGVEADAGTWKNEATKRRFIRDFVQMATKGLYSYDTQLLQGSEAKYYLVAIPEKALNLDDLPPEVRKLISRIAARLSFQTAEYITEAETLCWC